MNRLILVCAMLHVFYAGALAQAPGSETALQLEDLDGREVSLAQHRDRIVILNFWATWCVPCREEMPLLADIQKRYGGSGVQVIGASADDERTVREVPRFIRRLKINFPIWVGATTADMNRLNLGEALPATALLDRDGSIVARLLGPVKQKDVEQWIDWLLSDRHQPSPETLIDTFEEHAHEDEHHHEGEEEHDHGGVGVEGASTVPS